MGFAIALKAMVQARCQPTWRDFRGHGLSHGVLRERDANPVDRLPSEEPGRPSGWSGSCPGARPWAK